MDVCVTPDQIEPPTVLRHRSLLWCAVVCVGEIVRKNRTRVAAIANRTEIMKLAGPNRAHNGR